MNCCSNITNLPAEFHKFNFYSVFLKFGCSKMKNSALSQPLFPPFQDLLNGQDILRNKLTIHYSAVLKVFSYQAVFLPCEERIR